VTRRLVSWSAGQPLPRNADRKTLAAIITSLYFPVSPRTIEKPLRYESERRSDLCHCRCDCNSEAKLAAARTYKLATGRPTEQTTCGASLTLTVRRHAVGVEAIPQRALKNGGAVGVKAATALSKWPLSWPRSTPRHDPDDPPVGLCKLATKRFYSTRWATSPRTTMA
jgi:hypothetical protein